MGPVVKILVEHLCTMASSSELIYYPNIAVLRVIIIGNDVIQMGLVSSPACYLLSRFQILSKGK